MFEEFLRDPYNMLFVLAGITFGLVQVFKISLNVEAEGNKWRKRLIPPISIACGVFASWCVAEFTWDWTVLILGISFGLSATGLFENFKNLIRVFTGK